MNDNHFHFGVGFCLRLWWWTRCSGCPNWSCSWSRRSTWWSGWCPRLGRSLWSSWLVMVKVKKLAGHKREGRALVVQSHQRCRLWIMQTLISPHPHHSSPHPYHSNPQHHYHFQHHHHQSSWLYSISFLAMFPIARRMEYAQIQIPPFSVIAPRKIFLKSVKDLSVF